MSYVLAAEPMPGAPALWLPRFNERLAAVSAEAAVEGEADDAGRPHVISVMGRRLGVFFDSRPLPQRVMAEPLALERDWADAGRLLAAQRAHIVIVSMDEATSHEAARACAVDITLLAATLVELGQGLGVLWTRACKLIAAEAILRHADELARGVLPIDAWVQLQRVEGPSEARGTGAAQIVTIGLRPFVGREVELQAAPGDEAAAGRVWQVARHLIENGLQFKDGDRFRISDEELVRISFAEFGHRAGTPVLRLTPERHKAQAVPFARGGGSP